VSLSTLDKAPEGLMIKKILITISFTLLNHQVLAGRFLIPPIEESLVQYQSAKINTVLDNSFSLVVWNVHKGKDDQAWVDDMIRLAPNGDVFLLQEAMDDKHMKNVFGKDLDMYEWFFAKSFSYTKNLVSSGVASGATAKALGAMFHRTSDVEPIVGTPKTTLTTFYKLLNGKEIAVLNIHGLNKTSNRAFYRQLEETLAFIKNHEGPVVYAGDFNTNNKDKFAELEKRMAAYGLKRITYSTDTRKHKLDWIYYRGCDVIESEILYNYESSDHTPLRARLNCE
jgi:endonuclease/exonuclease/phosphatase family metal-dependent hydrolase